VGIEFFDNRGEMGNTKLPRGETTGAFRSRLVPLQSKCRVRSNPRSHTREQAPRIRRYQLWPPRFWGLSFKVGEAI
jgi:hypothetical protein